MRVFTPLESIALPTQTGDTQTMRLLRAHEPYILNEASAALCDALVRGGNMKGVMSFAEERPVKTHSKRKLVFFSGEVGDAMCVTGVGHAAALIRGTTPHIDFVTGNWDQFLFSDGHVFQHPITLRQAQFYDAWIEFDARAHRDRDIREAFADAIDVHVNALKPVSTEWANPSWVLREIVDVLYEKTGNPKVAIRIYTDSHYRSWMTAGALKQGDRVVEKGAAPVMGGLVEAGIDCYVIGDESHRLKWKRDGREERLWAEGIYDASGLFGSVEEEVAFLAGMDAVIAPDGGILQIACALGLPTLGLFGPTRGEVRSKYCPTLRYINGEMDCAPCWVGGDKPPCEGKNCEAMLRIEPELIVETVKDMLMGGTD